MGSLDFEYYDVRCTTVGVNAFYFNDRVLGYAERCQSRSGYRGALYVCTVLYCLYFTVCTACTARTVYTTPPTLAFTSDSETACLFISAAELHQRYSTVQPTTRWDFKHRNSTYWRVLGVGNKERPTSHGFFIGTGQQPRSEKQLRDDCTHSSVAKTWRYCTNRTKQ